MIQFGIELLIFSEIIPLTNLFSQSKMKGMDQIFFTWIYGSHLKCAGHKSVQTAKSSLVRYMLCLWVLIEGEQFNSNKLLNLAAIQ